MVRQIVRITLATASVLAALSLSTAAEVIEVPLEHRTSPSDDRGVLAVSRVQVADFDMLAPGAPAAPLDIDFHTSRARGLALAFENYTETATIAGRNCRRCYASFAFNADDRYVLKGNRPDLFVLVDYFDEGATNPQYLRFTYDAMTSGVPDPIPYRRVIGPDLGNSRAWNRHQFHLRDAYFGNRQQSRIPGSGPSEFLLMSWERDSFRPYGFADLAKAYEPPPGDWKFPPTTATHPIYTLVKTGEKSRLARFDVETSGDLVRSRMIFDENGNRDLTDDSVLTPSDTMDWGRRGFLVSFLLNTVCSAGGGHEPVQWQFQLKTAITSESLPIDRVDLFARRHDCQAGTFQLDGRQYRVAVVDRNCDGMYDTRTSSSIDGLLVGDRLYLGAQERFCPDGSYSGRQSQLVLSDHVVIGAKQFRLLLDPLARRLRLEPAPEGTGTLKLPAGIRTAQVYTVDTSHSIGMVNPPAEVRLPPGHYVLDSYTMERRDAQGDLWSLGAEAEDRSCSATVAAGRAVALDFGEPYSAAIETTLTEPAKAGEKKAVLLETRLLGRGREVVHDISHVEGTLTMLPLSVSRLVEPREPTYRIARPDGEIVADGSFEYG